MTVTFWIIFNAGILVLLFIDLAFMNRGGSAVPFRRAIIGSAAWVALALLFAVFVHLWMGPGKGLEFLTGYVLEESLSVDNLFVFILLFNYFKVPAEQEKTVLFWGIIGAMIMRGIFIVVGVALVRRFHWILYAFGVFLIWGGIKLMREGDESSVDPSRNVILRFCRKFLPLGEQYEGNRFLVRKEGKLLATPLFVVLLVVETTDILFATDSIPAILAITRDTFIVYASNVFAVLGLRSLYFALSGLIKLFHYLNYGLAVVLMFIGIKMLLSFRFEIPTWIVLCVIGSVLTISVGASLLLPKKEPETT
jgi:tellurite resistance protein TerC